MAADSISFVEDEIFQQAPAGTCAGTLKNKQLVERFLRETDLLKALLLWLENAAGKPVSFDKKHVLPVLLKAVNEIDRQLERQLNVILHHREFQALEAGWRCLAYLIGQKAAYDKEQKVKVKLLDCSWQVLSKDINRAIEFEQSEFFKLVYNNEYDMSGGEPFGAIIGNYYIGQGNRGTGRDIDVLKDIARTCAAAFAPFITSVHPSFFGADDFSDLAGHSDFSHFFEQGQYLKWHTLRTMEEARFLGLTLPYILIRAPYLNDGSRREGFKFKEAISDVQRDHLWGNAAFAFAGVLVRAFSESGWFGQIRGMVPGQRKKGLVCDLPLCRYETDLYQQSPKPSVNLLVGDRAEKALSDLGFIPLSAVPGSEHLVFYSNASVQKPLQFDALPANVNAKLSAMLQYILCVSRFAHYLKVLGREKVGSYQSARLCEQELQTWLHQYTTASDSASDEVRSKYPLHSARIQVKEMQGKPGHYYSVIQLQPHFQLDQMVSSIKLVTELTPKH
ncbi:type VI secretion system contractile sheath large subunit [Thalassomonas viridans]|uniref:Type VI secretion system contractile sheath large subunit n=1 Tax=Thalassomonas viridans TaxID=137584 RepID=A0AAE9Z135_9GAMM|nr:type VI secretion system contractile sheath large subunit [Thalassomonas viridans]WDE03287.1 type VI secretion system contractile sheath large subunit [Thalassomonas viridans]